MTGTPAAESASMSRCIVRSETSSRPASPRAVMRPWSCNSRRIETRRSARILLKPPRNSDFKTAETLSEKHDKGCQERRVFFSSGVKEVRVEKVKRKSCRRRGGDEGHGTGHRVSARRGGGDRLLHGPEHAREPPHAPAEKRQTLRPGEPPRNHRGDGGDGLGARRHGDRKSTRLNSSHANISYAVFCLQKKT